MSSSVQPISSAAMSALIQELESGSSALFGDPFAFTPVPSPSAGVSLRLARVLAKLRTSTLPMVVRSMNLSKVKVIWRSRVVPDDDDPLAVRYSTSESDVFAVVAGPSADDLDEGFMAASDYWALIPAANLQFNLDENDAIEIDGAIHDIVRIQAHPKTPPAVAYRYMCKRAR